MKKRVFTVGKHEREYKNEQTNERKKEEEKKKRNPWKPAPRLRDIDQRLFSASGLAAA